MNTAFPYDAIVIGASAGALNALSQILPALPENFAIPVVVVVHLPPDKDSILAQLLQAKCALPVHEAEDKQPLCAGCIFIAPPDYHLLIEKDGTLSLSSEEPVLFSRPSIDVLFESASDAFGDRLIGIVLTGANEDGAYGLKVIMDSGGTGIVQMPEQASSDMMPRAAIKLSPEAHVMSLPDIASYLARIGTAHAATA